MDRKYRVKWEIDIEAGSAEEAARKALAIQRDPGSMATVFSVNGDGRGENDTDLAEVVLNNPMTAEISAN